MMKAHDPPKRATFIGDTFSPGGFVLDDFVGVAAGAARARAAGRHGIGGRER